MIELIGILDWELTRLGFKPGDVITDHTKPSPSGAVYFDYKKSVITQNCVVWSDNYKVINKK